MDQILAWLPYIITALVLILPLYVISRMAGTLEARMWSAYDAAYKREQREKREAAKPLPPKAKKRPKATEALAETQIEHTSQERWDQLTSYRRTKNLCRVGVLLVVTIFIVATSIRFFPGWPSLAITIVGAAGCGLALYAATRPLSRTSDSPHPAGAHEATPTAR